jgi:DNA-binding SARP family transcriptional activator
VHNEVRAQLLPIAVRPGVSFNVQVATDAASALVAMDPYDEAATLALADCLSSSGRRIAARELLVRYAEDVRSELEESPPTLVNEATIR